jgi:hypothetical protein
MDRIVGPLLVVIYFNEKLGYINFYKIEFTKSSQKK